MDNIYYQNEVKYKDDNASTWKKTRLFTDLHSSSANYYTIGSQTGPKRGRCVILNYEHFFNPEKNRKGTEYDVSALKKTFESLNFEIIIHHDMTQRGTLLVLDNESQFDHSPYHCFVMCVLSHGEMDRFLCIENEGIKYDQVFTKFDGKHCLSLVGKPKLFFFQACQGDAHDFGVRLHENSTLQSFKHLQSFTHLEDFTHLQNFQEHSLLRTRPDNPQSHPITADQFAFYCSYRNFYSYRNPEKGSWFISELTSTFDTFSHQEDFISMIILVQKKVAQKEAARVTTRGQAGIKQMPLYFSTLLKKIMFS